jgi:hypothetical protein
MPDYVLRHKGTPLSLLQGVEQQLTELIRESKDQPNNWLNPEIPVAEHRFLTENLLPLIRSYIKIAETNPDSQQLINLINYSNIVPQPNQTPTPWKRNGQHR